MIETIGPYMAVMGRMLVGQIFIVSGLSKIGNWSGTAGYMASKGMPAIPIFLAMAILFEVGGGILLLIGSKARIGASALILFLIPTTLIFHNFWAYQGMDQQIQMINFMKNLAILGGLLLVISTHNRPLSVASGDAQSRAA